MDCTSEILIDSAATTSRLAIFDAQNNLVEKSAASSVTTGATPKAKVKSKIDVAGSAIAYQESTHKFDKILQAAGKVHFKLLSIPAGGILRERNPGQGISASTTDECTLGDPPMQNPTPQSSMSSCCEYAPAAPPSHVNTDTDNPTTSAPLSKPTNSDLGPTQTSDGNPRYPDAYGALARRQLYSAVQQATELSTSPQETTDHQAALLEPTADRKDESITSDMLLTNSLKLREAEVETNSGEMFDGSLRSLEIMSQTKNDLLDQKAIDMGHNMRTRLEAEYKDKLEAITRDLRKEREQLIRDKANFEKEKQALHKKNHDLYKENANLTDKQARLQQKVKELEDQCYITHRQTGEDTVVEAKKKFEQQLEALKAKHDLEITNPKADLAKYQEEQLSYSYLKKENFRRIASLSTAAHDDQLPAASAPSSASISTNSHDALRDELIHTLSDTVVSALSNFQDSIAVDIRQLSQAVQAIQQELGILGQRLNSDSPTPVSSEQSALVTKVSSSVHETKANHNGFTTLTSELTDAFTLLNISVTRQHHAFPTDDQSFSNDSPLPPYNLAEVITNFYDPSPTSTGADQAKSVMRKFCNHINCLADRRRIFRRTHHKDTYGMTYACFLPRFEQLPPSIENNMPLLQDILRHAPMLRTYVAYEPTKEELLHLAENCSFVFCLREIARLELVTLANSIVSTTLPTIEYDRFPTRVNAFHRNYRTYTDIDTCLQSLFESADYIPESFRAGLEQAQQAVKALFAVTCCNLEQGIPASARDKEKGEVIPDHKGNRDRRRKGGNPGAGQEEQQRRRKGIL